MAKSRKSKNKKRRPIYYCYAWLRARPRLLLAIIIIIICLSYVPLRAYQNYADKRKFSQARTAIDLVYADIVRDLGQPGNLKRTNSCSKTSGALHSSTICIVQTEFIYGVESRDQANVLLKRIQREIAASRRFKPQNKLSSSISDSLVFDTTYHDALDYYYGPHHIDCSVKYSFDTPDEVDLSIPLSSQKPFEVFFACSAAAGYQIYPAAS